MDFLFEKATADQIEQISVLFEKGRQFLKAQGIDQWQQSHSPSAAVVEADIQKGIGYVLRTQEGVVAAYAAVIPGREADYDVIEGQWLGSGPYCAIHRVTVSEAFRGRGVAKELLKKCREQAKELGAHSARIDTHADNRIMQKAILHSGFTYCGVVTLSYGAKRNAYEAML